MTPTKQTVYLPVSEFNDSERAICTIGIPDLYGDKVIEQEAFVFTPDQLNEYTANVIRQALETASENAEVDFQDYGKEFVDKQSITNTFDEVYKKLKI